MAPATQQLCETRLKPVLTFSHQLVNSLPDAQDNDTSGLLLAEVTTHIQSLSAFPTRPTESCSARTAKQLERQGRDLWNICLRLVRDKEKHDGGTGRSQLITKVRVLAYYMLSLGRDNPNRGHLDMEANTTYLLDLALKAARYCFQANDTEAGKALLQRANEYIRILACLGVQEKGRESVTKYEARYLTMRIALAWSEDQLEVVEHTFGRTRDLLEQCQTDQIEALADVLQNIGTGCLLKKDYTMALKWLQRAREALSTCKVDDLSLRGLETRLAVFQSLFRTHLGRGTTQALQEAENILVNMEKEMGDKPIILHWRVELLQHLPQEATDNQAYSTVLRRMVRAYDGKEVNIDFILYHIKELGERSTQLASVLLDELLLQGVVPTKQQEHVGKVLVRRIWYAVKGEERAVGEGAEEEKEEEKQARSHLKALENVLDTLYGLLHETVVSAAAGAAHSLIWKKIEVLTASGKYEIADSWCAVALHNILESSGEENLAKFGRKRIQYAIYLNKPEEGKQSFAKLPSRGQKDPLTSYLMFRLALLNWDHELGRESIENLSALCGEGKCDDVLYACIREAQHAGDKVCTLQAMTALTKFRKPDHPMASNYPSLLRCTIRLIVMLDESDSDEETNHGQGNHVEALCDEFDKGAAFAKADPIDQDGNKIYTIDELHWFRKNSYNIAVSKSQTWPLSQIVRLLNACLAFAGCYPSDVPLRDAPDIALMAMRCRFIIAAALVSDARAENGIEAKLQRYVEMRQHIAEFDASLQMEAETQEEAVIQDLIRKAATLFVFDFEGAVALRSWEELSHIVRKAKMCRDENMFKAMGDCLLRSQATGRVMFGTMSLIINEIFELERFDSEKLAKYLRCVFQATLPLGNDMALQLINQAIEVAREGQQNSRPFPHAELEWLVASSFNHAIDLYAQREGKATCHSWALRAIELASFAEDGGCLRKVLEERLAKLKFER